MARKKPDASTAPELRVEYLAADRLVPYARNTRRHTRAQIARLRSSIREFGFVNPILIDAQDGVIAGHARLEAATAEGMAAVPVIRLGHLTEAQRRAYVIADNRLAEMAEWDLDMLRVEVADVVGAGVELPSLGFDDAELRALLGDDPTSGQGAATGAAGEAGASSGEGQGEAEEADPADDAPPEPKKPASRRGDVWLLGWHRLACGDATQPEDVARLFAGKKPDLILTDQPYCSGGFQESGKSSGSIGTQKVKKGGEFEGGIANDKLSTRGYIALMKAVLGQVPDTGMLYAFTDWRMWIPLYDVAESSGFGVRSMLVWDKGYGGLGQGWRTQHELVMFAAKVPVKFDPSKSKGNVLAHKRTGNPLHPTQKPVGLISDILAVTGAAATVYDPFTGSGTTLMACEECSRAFLGMELSPGFVDVAVLRWQQATGAKATLEGDGRTYDEVRRERVGDAG